MKTFFYNAIIKKVINALISQFYVILIYMYMEIGGHHNKPHMLRDIAKFTTVRIAGLSIEWDNGIDIWQDELYNNSKVEE